MDGKEENVLIGEALWKGSMVMSRWMIEKDQDVVKGKSVLELGSGPGLCGFMAANLGAKEVILTDYKTQVMQLIAQNIKHVQSQNVKAHMSHAELDWYYASDTTYLKNLPVLDENMQQVDSFYKRAEGFDVIIGSDLLYFKESIEPLFRMIVGLQELNNAVFYMCMIRRGNEVH